MRQAQAAFVQTQKLPVDVHVIIVLKQAQRRIEEARPGPELFPRH